MTESVASSRPTVWTLLRQALPLWIGLFLFCVGSTFIVVGLQEASQERRYRLDGLTVKAVVTDKSIDRATREGNSATRYRIAYQLTTPEGEEVAGSTEVSVDDWERLEAGQPFVVTYVPDAPESGRVPGGDGNPWIAVFVMLAVGSVFSLVGGGLAFYQGRWIRHIIRLSRHGHPTEGTVVRVGPTSTRINREHQWRIDYTYRDHLGRSHEGHSHLLPPEDASVWHEGDTGIVRFDRVRPSLSVWIGQA